MSSLQSSTAPIKLACGSETILLVDDFAVLVDLTKAFLVKQGYTIYTALNGVEALKVRSATWLGLFRTFGEYASKSMKLAPTSASLAA